MFQSKRRTGRKNHHPREVSTPANERATEPEVVEDHPQGLDENQLPLILPRTFHPISRKTIDPDALKVLYRLLRAGHKAYLVGGAVRDLLLGKVPKDYDVGTDARPEIVRSLFRNSRIIGRRFKLNHVFFQGNKIIEVATFRALSGHDDGETDSKILPNDNTYGDPESDALRRDITINGLFYDLGTYSIIDYVGGIRDLRDGVVRIIGIPDERFVEDPVRIIRVVRHAARTGFDVDHETFSSIIRNSKLLHQCPKARVYEELLREIKGGYSLPSFRLMREGGC